MIEILPFNRSTYWKELKYGEKRNKSKNKILEIISLLIVLVIVLTGKNINEKDHTQANTEITENSSTLTYSLEDIPEYSGTPYAILNNNKPEFTEKDYTTKSFENYSELDSLGRCGVAYANVCKEIMPPERRWKRKHK